MGALHGPKRGNVHVHGEDFHFFYFALDIIRET